MVVPNRSKLLQLAFLTAELALGGVASEEILESVNGSWAFFMQFRRCLFSLCSAVYFEASPSGSRSGPFVLTAASRNELLSLAVGCSFCLTDIRARFTDRIYCTDASPSAAGGCIARVPWQLNAALWRFIDYKGTDTQML